MSERYAVKLTQQVNHTYCSIEQVIIGGAFDDVAAMLSYVCLDMDHEMLKAVGFVDKDRQWTAHPFIDIFGYSL